MFSYYHIRLILLDQLMKASGDFLKFLGGGLTVCRLFFIIPGVIHNRCHYNCCFAVLYRNHSKPRTVKRSVDAQYYQWLSPAISASIFFRKR